MAEFGKIDNPVDASFDAWTEESHGIGGKAGELALAFSGLILTPAKILKILKDQFASSGRIARIQYLLDGLRLGLKSLESDQESDRERLKAIEERLGTPQFEESVSTACEEAARATNAKKIEEFVSVLVGSLTPNKWADPNEDIAVMIRDIAQLGEKDFRVLGILASVHASAIASAPNLHEPDPFSRETPTLNRAINGSGIHRDDFLSTCERLRGFGLAAEVVRNTSQMAPHDYCYRPTRRGLAVLDYLRAAPRSAGAATKGTA